MSPFWRGYWSGISGGRGERAARVWGLTVGIASGILFSYFFGGAWGGS